MATIQLGALVTSLAGSVGGTTFRRNRNSITMSNKSRGTSNSGIKNSSSLNFLSQVFDQWDALSLAEKNSWQLITKDFPFPDKFGVMRTLSARQLFLKIASTARHFGSPVPSAFNVNSSVKAVSFEWRAISAGNGIAIDFMMDITEYFVIIQAVVLSSSFEKVQLKRQKVLFAGVVNKTNPLDISQIIKDQFNGISKGNILQLYVTPVNAVYYRGVTFVDSVELLA